jgi:hypothetical protein
MFEKKDLNMKKWILPVFALGTIFLAACYDSGNETAGTSEEAEGITAVTDWEVAGVSQKGPFVTGSAVTVQELDGITLKQTGKSFKGTIKSDKGDFAIKDINLQSQYAILEASGYYRDEISGKKSVAPVTLRALTDLSNRKTVNINLLTHLEYERVMYLVTEKKKSIAAAKAQADEEILAAFGIEGDFGKSEDLNIFESGDGNAALLAISVLMQADADVAGLTERMGEFSIAIAEGGDWEDADTKAVIADWACDADLKGTLANVRKNVEDWKYADTVPAFEKYVTNFWWDNYGLGQCTEKREGDTKRNVNKLSKMYNEYFVCESGRWVIPGEEPASSSSSSGKDESSSSVTPQSNEASSSSIYNPFDSVPDLPADLAFLDSNYKRLGYMNMADGNQKVWFFSGRKSMDNSNVRDSAAGDLVKILGKKDFAYEGIVQNDSVKMSGYSDTSYVYKKEKDNVVYKVAITKYSATYNFNFDIKVVILKKGFEELSTNASSRDSLPDYPSDMSFVKRYVKTKTEYTEYADGKQVVWRGETYACGSGCDDLAAELVGDATAKGFADAGTYSNDSLDNVYTEDSHVYTKTSGGKVYSLVITKGETTVVSPVLMRTFLSGMLYIKVIARDAGIDEIPTEPRKDYSSPKYRDMPADLAFIMDATDSFYRTYSDDSLRTTWICYSTVGRESELPAEAVEKADEYATLVESHGFTLKSREEYEPSKLQSMGYWSCNMTDDFTPVTLYRFEKEVAGFYYKVDVYSCVTSHLSDLGIYSYEANAYMETSIYDK